MADISLDKVRSDLELSKLVEEFYETASTSYVFVNGTSAIRWAQYARGNTTVTVDNTLSASNVVTSSTRTVTQS